MSTITYIAKSGIPVTVPATTKNPTGAEDFSCELVAFCILSGRWLKKIHKALRTK